MHGLLVSVGASKRRRKKARGWWISQSELDVVGKDQCDTINACICVFSCADTCSRSVSVESTVRTPQLEQLANCNTHSETLFHAAPALETCNSHSCFARTTLTKARRGQLLHDAVRDGVGQAERQQRGLPAAGRTIPDHPQNGKVFLCDVTVADTLADSNLATAATGLRTGQAGEGGGAR